MIKTLNDKHTCPRINKNRHANSGWLSRRYTKELRHGGNFKMSDVLGQVRKDFVVQPSKTQVYRAKLMAGELIEGSLSSQYSKLWYYAKELNKTNPESTLVIDTELVPDDTTKFKRIYICFNAYKQGIDADNGYYPIAYVVVEKEWHESWSWFLQLLKEDLNLEDYLGITFMTDRQKGLVESICDIWPICEHRFCVRHMYANFKKKFKDDIIKGKLWKAARSTKVEDFQTYMAKIKELNENAWKWLNEISLSQWSNSFFSVHSKCDMTLNNLREIVNGDREVLEARSSPIYSLSIGLGSKEIWEFCGSLGSINQTPIAIVNLKGKNCTCRKWNLTGIPCQHAIAAIYSEYEDPMKYADIYYHKESQMKCYGDVMYGINMEKYWTKTGRPPLVAPRVVKQPGHPKTLRIREIGEIPPSQRKFKLVHKSYT
ncbi:hypothetical protein LWI29_029189 [Acer saccharum]|uniref:SWIM-type domain-containing protein n=1 Tax=Acer saccharum TaxID=4024 RepID=A0AA39S4R1_ACESA|nr:hypothetical protein LWI29_029189 [Acer saccharum]